MNKQDRLIGVFALIFLCSVAMIFVENSSLTGHAVESTTSSVTISQYFSIAMSNNLSAGIGFGTKDSTSQTNINATSNYLYSNASEYYMQVSEDSNTAVDFTIYADGPMNTSGGDEIGIGNESFYHVQTTTNLTQPDVADEASLSTSPQAAGTGVAIGDNVYYRFWLDIPAGTPVGEYNNTISVEGVAAT